LRKSEKSAEKFVRTTSYRQLRDFKKILQQFRSETVDVQCLSCTYIQNVPHVDRYIALTASVKFRIGSPKTARNEQVCAHQESYTE